MKRIILVTIVLLMMVGLCPIKSEAKGREELDRAKWESIRCCQMANYKAHAEVFEIVTVGYSYVVQIKEEYSYLKDETNYVCYFNSKGMTVFLNGRLISQIDYQ